MTWFLDFLGNLTCKGLGGEFQECFLHDLVPSYPQRINRHKPCSTRPRTRRPLALAAKDSKRSTCSSPDLTSIKKSARFLVLTVLVSHKPRAHVPLHQPNSNQKWWSLCLFPVKGLRASVLTLCCAGCTINSFCKVRLRQKCVGKTWTSRPPCAYFLVYSSLILFNYLRAFIKNYNMIQY